MKYLILEEEYVDRLNNEVNWHIKQGWRPQGGVSAYHGGGMYTYYQQAMVKGD